MTTPLALDLARLPVALAGAGPALMKRLALLDGEDVPRLRIYAADPGPELTAAAGSRLVNRWPLAEDVAALRILFVAGLPHDQSAALAALARAHRVLINVEDVRPLCDFHVPAILRRGDLALSVSTGGASPTLSRRLATYLAELFPGAWADRVVRIANLRQSMRESGAGMRDVARATDRLIDAEGWLPPAGPPVGG